MTQFPKSPERSFKFLDLKNKRLITLSQAFVAIRDALVRDSKHASLELVEEHLLILMAIRATQIPLATPAVYMAELDALMDRLRDAAFAARIQDESPWATDYNSMVIHPSMPGDPRRSGRTQEAMA